jgi:hypothetical protein
VTIEESVRQSFHVELFPLTVSTDDRFPCRCLLKTPDNPEQ